MPNPLVYFCYKKVCIGIPSLITIINNQHPVSASKPFNTIVITRLRQLFAA